MEPKCVSVQSQVGIPSKTPEALPFPFEEQVNTGHGKKVKSMSLLHFKNSIWDTLCCIEGSKMLCSALNPNLP